MRHDATRGRLGAAALVALALLVLHVRPAHARPAPAPAGAVALFEQAKRQYANGDFIGARALLDQARTKTAEAALLAQIHLYRGICLAAEGETEAARASFRAAIARDATIRVDPVQFKPALIELFDSTRRSLEGELVVSAGTPRAEIWIDGARVGPTPYTGLLLAGAHEVVVKGERAQLLHRRRVQVGAGRTTRVDFLPPARGGARLDDDGADATDTADEDELPQDADARPGRLWTWIAGGAALVAAGVGIGFGSAAVSDRESACALLADPSLPCGERSTLAHADNRGRYDELRDSVDTKRTVFTVAWITAGVLAAGTVALYWLEGRKAGAANDRARLVPAVGSDRVSIGWTF